jgi:ATP-binding cassette subfamily F protein uup
LGTSLICYAGGYDDWLSQKKDVAAKETKQKSEQREKKKPEVKKLSFKEKRELETLPAVIEEKENRKHEIFRLMGDPSFYQESGNMVADLRVELELLEKELEEIDRT